MDKTPINLFQNIPEELNQELVEKLIEQDSFRLERIVSRGQISPPDFWYDQDEHEWVVILAGKAQLQIDGLEQPVTLNPGDTYNLPAHTKHRVAWTAPNQDTIWLTVFWKSE
jgi:cupin 2 domain-containing protein